MTFTLGSDPDLAMFERCYSFHFISSPLDINQPIYSNIYTKVVVKCQHSGANVSRKQKLAKLKSSHQLNMLNVDFDIKIHTCFSFCTMFGWTNLFLIRTRCFLIRLSTGLYFSWCLFTMRVRRLKGAWSIICKIQQKHTVITVIIIIWKTDMLNKDYF